MCGAEQPSLDALGLSDADLLVAVTDRLLRTDPTDLPGPAALERTRALLVQGERLRAAGLRAVRDLDARELYVLDGAGNASVWLSRERVGGRSAPLATARRLGDYEAVSSALAAGQLELLGGERVCAALAKLPAEVDEPVVASVLSDGVRQLLHELSGGSDPDPEGTSDVLAQAAAAVDLPLPVRVEPVFVLIAQRLAPALLVRTLSVLVDALLPEEHLQRWEDEQAETYLDVRELLDGYADVKGVLDPETAVALRRALARRALAARRQGGDGMTAGQRRVLALRQLLRDAAAQAGQSAHDDAGEPGSTGHEIDPDRTGGSTGQEIAEPDDDLVDRWEGEPRHDLDQHAAEDLPADGLAAAHPGEEPPAAGLDVVDADEEPPAAGLDVVDADEEPPAAGLDVVDADDRPDEAGPRGDPGQRVDEPGLLGQPGDQVDQVGRPGDATVAPPAAEGHGVQLTLVTRQSAALADDQAVPLLVGVDCVLGLPGALPGRYGPGLSTSLPVEAVRRLGCGGHLAAVLLDAHGMPIGASGTHRHATERERRALLARWGGTCATDGCGRPGVVPHHAEPWWLTRRTRLEDLVPYCDGCHHDLHEGGKTIKLRNGRWVGPTGWTDPPADTVDFA